MKTEDWKNIERIVNEALEIDVSRRQEFIAERCANSPEIRREVESLLESEAEAENLFEAPAIADYAGFFSSEGEPSAIAGQEIGNYRVIREIGYGGMGAVYLAERSDGKFKQKVALKMLKREMNTSALRHRFEQERAILASLENPNIARLLDAGTTGDQIPFLAMEYVEGLPIDDFCNINNLDLSGRLDLFRKVCAAVNFAHRNLVVHRDLKPSNILVDAAGNPKLLDFGISKILSAEVKQINSATVTRLGAMTPGYASPEQLQNKSVTTATDIYSLGVILYELLSGHRPFESKENNLEEIYKAVIETEPERPSSVIQNSKFKTQNTEAANDYKFQTGDSISKDQKSETKGQNQKTNLKSQIPNPRLLVGDLDNIVLKALRKEPERRYTSAENLAEDIHRYQRGLPVTARPNTFFYRAEKFIRRNRISAIVAGLLILAIIAGIAATLRQSKVAAAERDRARLEAEKVKKINAYTQNILNFSNPMWVSSNPQRNREAKISDALEEALKNIDTYLADQPEMQAEILFTIGATYIGQGQYEKSTQLLRRSIEKFDQALGVKNVKSMQASATLAEAVYLSGKIAEAEQLLIEAVDYFRPLIAADKSQSKVFAIAASDLATIYMGTAKYREAEDLLKESISTAKDFTGKDRQIMPVLLGNLGFLYATMGKFPEAIDLYRQALDELRLAGNTDKYDTGTLYMKMGVTFFDMEDYAQAGEHYQKSYDILLKTVGKENVYTNIVAYRLAHNYYKQGKIAEAEKLTDENLERQKTLLPNGHILVGWLERLKGEIYTKTGRAKEGEEFIQKSLSYFLKTHKEPSRNISQAKLALGENLIAQKRYAEAEPLISSALENSIKSLGENHPFTRQCRESMNNLSKLNEN